MHWGKIVNSDQILESLSTHLKKHCQKTKAVNGMVWAELFLISHQICFRVYQKLARNFVGNFNFKNKNIFQYHKMLCLCFVQTSALTLFRSFWNFCTPVPSDSRRRFSSETFRSSDATFSGSSICRKRK